MAKLNQILAVESGATKAHESATTEIYHLAQKHELFAGRLRTYRPKDEDGDKLPPETQFVVATASKLLPTFAEAETKIYDITATKVWANQRAHADVVVDGVLLLEKVPVEYLLFLEKRLALVNTFLSKLPTLDPTVKWTFDTVNDWYASAPAESTKSVKVLKNHLVHEGNDKHAPQVQTYTADELIGYWSATQLSGAMPASEVAVLKDKVGRLIAAVKMAREEANSIEVENKEVGGVVFRYLFD